MKINNIILIAILHTAIAVNANDYYQNNEEKSLSFVAPSVGGVANIPSNETPGLIVLDANDGIFKGKGWDGAYHNLGTSGQVVTIRNLSTNTSLLSTDDVIIASGTTTLTLSSSTTSGKTYEIRNSDGSTITIITSGTDIFDGYTDSATSLTLRAKGDHVRLSVDSSTPRKWHILAEQRTVIARYNSTTATALSTSGTDIPFTNKDYDTYNSSLSSNISYTCPISGKYRVSAIVTTASVATSTSQAFSLDLYKNGSSYSTLWSQTPNGATTNLSAVGSDTVDCTIGNTLKLRASGYNVNMFGNSGLDHVTFERIGN